MVAFLRAARIYLDRHAEVSRPPGRLSIDVLKLQPDGNGHMRYTYPYLSFRLQTLLFEAEGPCVVVEIIKLYSTVSLSRSRAADLVFGQASRVGDSMYGVEA